LGRDLVEEKVELTPEKWGNFPLVTPIVIITTVSKEGIPNAAIKSWVMTVGGSPPLIVFSCSMKHDTAKNLLETREFVLNVPNNDIAEKALITAESFPRNVNEIEKAGLTAFPSKKVKPPSIKECIAHAECVLEEVKTLPIGDYGEIGNYGNLFIGKVVYASVNRELLEASEREKYKLLDQMMTYDVDGQLRPDKIRRKGS
jgi:flavin reductase (DIM6/NTAB) family NADH-FMN oxidoreductase RutF